MILFQGKYTVSMAVVGEKDEKRSFGLGSRDVPTMAGIR